MELYGVAAIILLVAVSYYAGMRTANWYNDRAAQEQKDALERQYARIRTGSDYYDPVGPYIRSRKTGFTPSQLEEVEERLKSNGSAVYMLNRNPAITDDKKRGDITK